MGPVGHLRGAPEIHLIFSVARCRRSPNSAICAVHRRCVEKQSRAWMRHLYRSRPPLVTRLLMTTTLRTMMKKRESICKFHLLRTQLAEKARVVIKSCGTHDPAQNTGFPDAEFTTAEQVARPDPKTAHKDGRLRYGTSKLVVMMWAYALNRRFAKVPEKGWTVNIFDPGLMPGTELAREYPAFLRIVW